MAEVKIFTVRLSEAEDERLTALAEAASAYAGRKIGKGEVLRLGLQLVDRLLGSNPGEIARRIGKRRYLRGEAQPNPKQEV